MNIPEHIEVRSNGIVANILAPDSDGIKDCFVNNVLNGESILEFSIPSNNEKAKDIEPENEFYVNGRIYNILQEDAVDQVMEENGAIWNKYMAQERWNVLDKEFPKPWITNDPTIPTPAQLSIIIVGGGSNLSGNQYITGSAAHALYAVLQHSSWTMGTCDVTGIHDLELEKVSILEAIKQIQAVWGGYLVWDSINKVVHLRDGDQWQNYTGFQFRYAKNIKGLTRTQSNRIVTRLYCFGENNLSIASINDGKLYVEDFGYTNAIYEDIYSNPDIHDPEELKQKGIAELALNSRPRYAYNLKAVDLRTLPDYSHENFEVGDMVDVLNDRMTIDSTVRVMSHKYNVFHPWECEATLGDINERFIEKLKASFNTTSFIDRTFSSAGAMSGSKLVDGTVFGNSIANAALDASKFNTKQLILTGDAWNDNTPTGSYVQWNSHKLFYGGQAYDIIGQDTDKKYIVWQPSIDIEYYQTYTDEEFELVVLADDEFIIAINNGGLHDIAWYNRPARQFISSAFIADAAIKTAHIEDAAIVNAKIDSVNANKIDAGILSGMVIKGGEIYIGGDGTASNCVFGVDEYGNILGLQSYHAGIAYAENPVEEVGTFTVDGNMIINGSLIFGENASWGTPVIQYQYSADNSSWHDNQLVTDKYRREKLIGGTWGAGYQFIGEDGQDGAPGSSASVPSYIKSTYIDQAKVVSGQVIGGLVYATGQGADAGAAFYISDGITGSGGNTAPNPPIGWLSYDSHGAGSTIEAKNRMFLHTEPGTALKIDAGSSMSISSAGTTHAAGNWKFNTTGSQTIDFSNATVTGLTTGTVAVFG